MTFRFDAAVRNRKRATGLKVGFFGLLGAGNIGNDGSLEVVLAHVREHYPDAELGCLCSGPGQVQARYGIPSTSLLWYTSRDRRVTGLWAAALKAAGKVIDSIRTITWTRRFDVVIVPGAGVLETTLPLRAWGFPYALCLLSLSGRLWGTRVALLNVGSNVVRQDTTRLLFRTAARFAHYRSFRDALSRDALGQTGLDTSNDQVYPELVFSLPDPPPVEVRANAVGVGVMEFHGSNDDRRRAREIRESYVAAMKEFVHWLVDNDREVRLLTGDAVDDTVVEEVLADVRSIYPGLPAGRVSAAKLTTLGDLLVEIASLGVVVGARYHNVVCSLKLAKPTISISYSAKSDHIMADMGLGEFCQSARAVDVDRLIRQFTDLEARDGEFRAAMTTRVEEKRSLLDAQYAVLAEKLFADPLKRTEVLW
ncbi:polysaccharide pyruvyl transferase family protein [Amycolatopsis sp. NPDC005232]|uniref:polysaccharide pyruvyl transferase family protein n=1 Tax=Amycolatopsis sp. NPDC005232 TaxID=3157027 RepID=UPI0033BA870E